jgi:hypothetical protein
MKLHLIKSREVNAELFTQVTDLLGAISGPQFSFSKSHIMILKRTKCFPNAFLPPKFEQLEDQMACSNVAERSFPWSGNVTWETLFKGQTIERVIKLPMIRDPAH